MLRAIGNTLYKIPFLNRVRRNHALEHATIHILSRRRQRRLHAAGRSAHNGFFLYGDLETAEVEAAVREALARLCRGERELAVHPRCGTGVATAGVLAGLAAFVAMQTERKGKWAALPRVLTYSTLAVLVSQPLGLTVQREFTTEPNLEDVRIGRIQRRESPRTVVHRVEVERG